MYTVILMINAAVLGVYGVTLLLSSGTGALGIITLVMACHSLLLLVFKGKDAYLVGFTSLTLYHLGLTAFEALNLGEGVYAIIRFALHTVLGIAFLLSTLHAAGKVEH